MIKLCEATAIGMVIISAGLNCVSGCGSATNSEAVAQIPSQAAPVVPNEIAAGLVGETLNLAQDAAVSGADLNASTACTQVNPATIALSHPPSQSPTEAANDGSWIGTLEYTSSVMVCGITPSATFVRQFVTAPGGRPGEGEWKSASGETVRIDDSTPNLGNYRSDMIFPLVNGGYGREVEFIGQTKTQVDIDEHLSKEGAFDLSIVGSLKLSSDRAAREILSGTMSVYRNRQKKFEILKFDSVSYQKGCCFPVAGEIRSLLGVTKVFPLSCT